MTVFSRQFTRIFVARLCFSAAHAVLLIGLPLIMADMAADHRWIGLVMGTYAAGVLAARPVATWLLHRYTRRFVATLGAAFFAGLPSLYWVMPDVDWYVPFRFLQGTGFSLILVATTVLVIDQASPNQRGQTLGHLGVSHTAMLAVGPLLAVHLFERLGAHALLAAASLVAIAGLGLLTRVEESAHPDGGTVGGPGGLRVILRVGIAVPMTLLFLNALVHGGVFYFLPLYVRTALGENGGLFFTCFAATAMIARLIAGRLSDTVGRRPVGFVGQCLLVCGVFLVGRIQSIGALVAAGLVYGAGFGAYMPAMTALVSDRTTHANRALIISAYLSALDLGNAMAGWIMGALAGRLGIPGMFQTAFWVSAAAAVVYLVFLPPRREAMPHAGPVELPRDTL